jgi:hypothetical protein
MQDLTGRSLPRIEGRTLAGRGFDFPEDLDAGGTLLLVAFRQRQQADVDTWLPIARRLAAAHPGFAFFEVPLLDRRWMPMRSWIDGGMRAGIPDPAVRATTLTAYQSRTRFLRALGLAGIDHIVSLLVDRDGVIRWSAPGPLQDEDTAADLEEAVGALM